MTAVLLPNGKQQYFTTAGLPAVGYKIATFDAGTSNPRVTWVDAGKVTPNANPVILDARGEAPIFWEGAYKVQLQDSTGAVIWTEDNLQGQQNNFSTSLVPAVTNTIDLGSVTLSWRNLYLGAGNAQALDTVTGNIGYYARTAAEIAASVTPVNFSYFPGHVLRYGTNTTPGTTDMTTPFNNALASNKRVYAPAGTYFCSASLNLTSGQTFYGDGAATVLQWSNPNLNNIVGNGITNTTVRDLKINITSGAGVSNVGAIVFSNNSIACKAHRVEIAGANWQGVWIQASSYCEVTECWFHDFLGTQASTADVFVSDDGAGVNQSNYCIIANNECFGGGWFGVAFMEFFGVAPGVVPSQCIALGNRIGAHKAYGILFYSVTNNTDTWNQAIGNRIELIDGTVITGNSGAGIYVAGHGGAVIGNNTIRNTGLNTSAQTLTPAAIGINGVNATTLSPFTITGNVIRDHRQYFGIEVSSCDKGGTISGNSISLQSFSPLAGIYVQGSSNVAVTGNTLNILNTLTSCDGIFVFATRASTNITISGNTISGCANKCIRLDQSGGFNVTGFTITGNVIDVLASGTTTPIAIVAGVNGTVTANVCKSANLVALLVNGSTNVRYANNVLSSTGTNSVSTTGVCTGSYFDKSNQWNANMSNVATGLIAEWLGNALPSVGTWAVGDRTEQSVPVVAQPKGWRCTVAGSPGTWVSEGNL